MRAPGYLGLMLDRPQTSDVVLAAVLAVALELQIFLSGHLDAEPIAVVGALALTLPIAWRRRAPFAVAVIFASATVLQGALGGGVYAEAPPPFAALVAGGVVFYSLGAYAEERRAQIGLGLGIAGLWTTVLVAHHADLQGFLFSAGLIAVAPWLGGRVARSRTLRAAAIERAAASEERQRIARELHDVVAHGVVLMVLQAQGARRILDQDPERVREALEAIEDTGKTAVAEIRRSLGILREDGERAALAPQPTLDDLGTLVDDMRGAGLQVELSVTGAERAVDDSIGRSAYRIVQEALTNTIKHAGLVPTRVTVAYRPDDLVLEIADDGPGHGHGDGTGQGLAGMRERVRLLSGELEAHTANGRGFVVRARIPT
jgi:signal transduction histidine kinase